MRGERAQRVGRTESNGMARGSAPVRSASTGVSSPTRSAQARASAAFGGSPSHPSHRPRCARPRACHRRRGPSKRSSGPPSAHRCAVCRTRSGRDRPPAWAGRACRGSVDRRDRAGPPVPCPVVRGLSAVVVLVSVAGGCDCEDDALLGPCETGVPLDGCGEGCASHDECPEGSSRQASGLHG